MKFIPSRPAGLVVAAAVACISVCAAPAALGAGSKGTIKVTVIKKNGKTDTKAEGYQVCATPKPYEGATGTTLCGNVHKGKTSVKNLAPGKWYLQIVGGTGLGPCFNKKNDGKTPKTCSKVPVKAGATTRVKWRVPKFG
jgi:hypothetical protein